MSSFCLPLHCLDRSLFLSPPVFLSPPFLWKERSTKAMVGQPRRLANLYKYPCTGVPRNVEKSAYAKRGRVRRKRQKAGQTTPQPNERTERSIAKSVRG